MLKIDCTRLLNNDDMKLFISHEFTRENIKKDEIKIVNDIDTYYLNVSAYILHFFKELLVKLSNDDKYTFKFNFEKNKKMQPTLTLFDIISNKQLTTYKLFNNIQDVTSNHRNIITSKECDKVKGKVNQDLIHSQLIEGANKKFYEVDYYNRNENKLIKKSNKAKYPTIKL